MTDLERYADAIVRSCVRLEPGELLILVGDVAHRELLVALAEAGYRAGARLVDVSYTDPLVRAARIRWAREEDLGPAPPWWMRKLRAQLAPDTAMVTVMSESEPDAFAGLPPERVATDHQRPVRQVRWYLRGIQQERRRWAGASWPTPAWAAQVYPDLDSEEGQRRLFADLLDFCRLGPDDPPGFEGWERHVDAIAARAATLTELALERVELRGPGTDLSVRLPPGTRWLGGREANAHGRVVAPNFPTEENFTTPEARSTSGTFRCSRPLSFHGRLIEGIAGEFRSGRLVRLEAANDDDRDFLAAFLDTDPGARRLGEVALVDSTSRIGRSGRFYSNTPLDENAAAHIAFGFGFEASRQDGARGVNRSTLHLDVMIGTDDFEATGIAAGGRCVPLIRDGLWQM